MHKRNCILVTGSSGFIGFHVCKLLLEKGNKVVGVDSNNDYYDISLKHARLKILEKFELFSFEKADIGNYEQMKEIFKKFSPGITKVISLAAQAGVRYSLTNPFEYVYSNVMGHTVMLELAKQFGKVDHFIFASSSSVYGMNQKLPFSESDRVDLPMSLYAATKRSDELIATSYSHLYKIPITALRFFSVYGPWGRPDMALFIFTKNIIDGKPISLFNNGDMKRSFTYIDDIAEGVVSLILNSKAIPSGDLPYQVLNLGNNKTESLIDYVKEIEKNLAIKAKIKLESIQMGDVPESFADISMAKKLINFKPKTNIDVGIKNFVDWYKSYYSI